MRYAKVKKINTDQCYNNEYVVESVHASIYGALKKGTPVFEVSDEIGVGESVDCNGKKSIKMYS